MTQQQILVQIVLNNWYTQVKRAKALFDQLTDAQLLSEISPGRNRGIYLLGHLVAANDGLFSIYGLSENLHPELPEAFTKSPDKSGLEMPSIADLRTYWDDVHDQLATSFAAFSTEDWLSRHALMTDADLEKDPARNKLSVLINRTSHLAYHLGQVALLQSKA